MQTDFQKEFCEDIFNFKSVFTFKYVYFYLASNISPAYYGLYNETKTVCQILNCSIVVDEISQASVLLFFAISIYG